MSNTTRVEQTLSTLDPCPTLSAFCRDLPDQLQLADITSGLPLRRMQRYQKNWYSAKKRLKYARNRSVWTLILSKK